jgi:hypothetical protein
MKFIPIATALTIACTVASGFAAAQAVVAVRPSGRSVPDNLLRLSIVFAEPPQVPLIPRLQLRRDDGTVVDSPFDPQELWSPDGLTLTVLFQPGRVKAGLVAHDTLGRALVAGEHVRLVTAGREIATWDVAPGNSTSPDPVRWKIAPPQVGTRTPLVVTLDKPIDAMGRDFVAVAGPDGRRVPGNATLSEGETRWTLVPRKPWRHGAYAVVVNAELEDSSGNRVGERFEHSVSATAASPEDISLRFRIR